MKLRRLLPLLLVLCLLLPATAPAEQPFFDIRLEYMADDGSGNTVPQAAVQGQHFLWDWADAEQTHFWIQMIPPNWFDSVRITAMFAADGSLDVPFVDGFGNEWLQTAGSDVLPVGVHLSVGGEDQGFAQITVSQNAYVPGSETGDQDQDQDQPSPAPKAEMPAHESDWGQVPYDEVMLWDDSLSYPIGGVSNGEYLQMLETQQRQRKHDDQGNLWVPVTNKEGTLSGYIQVTNLQFLTKDQEKTLLTPPVVNDEMPAHESNYGNLRSDEVMLFDDSLTYPIGSAGTSTVLQMVETQQRQRKNDASGKLWVPVTNKEGTLTGYVPVKDFQFLTAEAEYKHLNPVKNDEMPTHESNWGKVSSDEVMLYDDSLTYPIGGVPRDAYMQMVETQQRQRKNDASGKLWVPVTNKEGTLSGYIQVTNLSFLTKTQENDLLNPVANQEMPARESDMSRLSAAGALYSDVNGQPVAQLAANTLLSLNVTQQTPAKLDEKGKLWVPVQKPDGTAKGYVKVDSLTFLTANQENEYRAEFTAPASNYGSVAAGAGLYNAAGEKIGTLSGSEVMVYQQGTQNAFVTDQFGNRLVSVKQDGGQGLSGYVRQQEVNFYTKEQERAYLDSKTPKQQMPAHQSNYGKVKLNNTAIYKTVGGQELARLSSGMILEMTETAQTPAVHDSYGNLWVPVRKPDGLLSGYMAVDSFQFMTAQEETAYRQPLNNPSDYGTVTAAGAPLYDAQGRQTATLTANAVVIYQPTAANSFRVDDYGTRYVYVKEDKTNGASGYIRQSDMAFMTQAQAQQYVNNKQQPTPIFTPRYAYVTGNPASVANAVNGATTAQAARNSVVYLTDEVTTSANARWYRAELVEVSGRPSGYIRAEQVRLMTDTEQANYIANQQKPQTQVTGFMRTNVPYAPLLVFPSIGAAPLASLPLNSAVYVWEQARDENGNVYHYVQYTANNAWGYVLSQYLTPMTPQEIADTFKTPQPTPKTAPTFSPLAFSGYGLLTSNGVNFRQQPSTTSTRITQLGRGTIVRIISDTTGADGTTWYQAESNGKTGYLHGDYVSLLSINEYQTLVSSQSYNQNGQIITPTATAKGIDSSTWATQRPSAYQTITFVTIPPMATPNPSATVDPYATPTANPFASPTVDPFATQTPDPFATGIGMFGSASPSPTVDPWSTQLPLPSPTFETKPTGGSSTPSLLLALVVLLILVAGGFYGYSVYNKARRKQAQEQAQRLKQEASRKEQANNLDAHPAVRRPQPPVTPGQPGANGAKPPQPGQPGANGAKPPQPGQPGANGAKPPQPGQPGSPQNPYMRPGTPPPAKPPVQDVVSTLPRAEVDGKPVDSRPNMTQTPANPRPQAPAPTRMPVAPPPTAPDNEPEPTARRRRRPQADDQKTEE